MGPYGPYGIWLCIQKRLPFKIPTVDRAEILGRERWTCANSKTLKLFVLRPPGAELAYNSENTPSIGVEFFFKLFRKKFYVDLYFSAKSIGPPGAELACNSENTPSIGVEFFFK